MRLQPGKDAGVDRSSAIDVAAAEDTAVDLPTIEDADTAAGEPDVVLDVPADAQARDLAADTPADTPADAPADTPADAPCLPPFTECCGMCLPPNAGICAPCVSDGGRDAAGDSPAEEDGASATDARFACADAACEADQYCISVYPGVRPRCLPRESNGACPPGTRQGCDPGTSYDGGGCMDDYPIRTCQSLPSTCTSGDPCICLCGLASSGGGCTNTGKLILCAYP